MAATEVPEGILSGSTETRVYSVSSIEVQDLLSEGQIEGIVTGEYNYSGNYGETGWAQAEMGPTYSFLRSIYWNEVPVMDSSNNLNFQQVRATQGKGQSQGEINVSDKLKERTSKTRNISERLRGPTHINGRIAAPYDEFSKKYRVLNKDCIKVTINIKVANLSVTSRAAGHEGDIEDHSVLLSAKFRPLFSTANKVSTFVDGFGLEIKGKTTGPYIASKDLPLTHTNSTDPDFIGWEIKVYRSTLESETMDIRGTTFMDSLTEHFNSKFAYPNSAIASQKFSAEYFSSIPQRAFDVRGIRVKIPSNYNPVTKKYTGFWDGTFKSEKHWTDNPAWCFYDLITNKRYGLGKYISDSFVDKWSLYEISQYCDVMVPDGFGGVEPRFSCNLYIQSREEAFKVVNDMSSIFRGITYYAGGGIYSVQDSPKEPVYTFANANVKDGDFNYSSSSKKVRHTVAIIRYNDKTNFYEPAMEYVEDVDGIRKHGIREIEMTAFGCTSRGQAIRLGRWALFTENMETESISFGAGAEGAYLRPGDVFSIYDSNRTKNRWAGRCKVVDAYSPADNANYPNGHSVMVLDQGIQNQLVEGREYKFTLLTPTYHYDPVQVTDLDSRDYSNIRRVQTQSYIFTGSKSDNNSVQAMNAPIFNSGHYPELSGYTRLVLYSGFQKTDHVVAKNSIWSIEPVDADYTASEIEEGLLPENKYRVIKVEEGDNVYNVAGIEYTENKYSAIESGLSFDDLLVTVVPDRPKDIKLTERKITENTRLIDYEITPPDDQNGLSSYNVYAKQASKWIKRDYTGNYPYLIPQGNLNNQQTNNALVPDPKWRIAVLPKDDKKGTYLPTGQGDYSFRAFSSNVAGIHSPDSVWRKINIPVVKPLLDLKIKNLREVDDADNQINAGGSKQNSITEKTDLEFKWTTTVASEQIAFTDYTYRITIRPPRSTITDQALNSTILYQTTGYNPNRNLYSDKETTSWALPFTGNVKNVTNGPWRDFDITVEAHDENGNTSAGGSFNHLGQESSNFTNAAGYDKYRIRNPAIYNPILGTNDDIMTEQSLTIDKEVKILFRRNYHTDGDNSVQGAFVYISKDSFATSDVQGKTLAKVASDRKTAGKAVIEAHRIEPYVNPIIITPEDYDLRNADTAHIAYSLYDSFEQRWGIEASHDVPSSLTVSNVKKIIKGTEIVDVVGDGFKVWIRLQLDGSWVGQGIDKVEVLDMTHASLPARYKNYNGYTQYSCYYVATTVRILNAYDASFPGQGPVNGYPLASTAVNYFPNYYCGWNQRTLNRGARKIPAGGFNGVGQPTSWRDADLKEGFKRFRVWIDQKYAPESDNYAVIGQNINNEDYFQSEDQTSKPSYYHPSFALWAKNVATHDEDGNSTEPGYYDGYHGDGPSTISHHPAGFGQGFCNLIRTKKYFDVHMGHLMDMSYLREAFFGVITKGDDKDAAGKILS